MTTTAASPPQQLALTPQTSRVSPETVDEAVKALLKWRSEKSKTQKPQLLEQDEFVYLIITLKKIPQTSRTKPHRIRIPHPLINTTEDSPEICLIFDDRPKSGLTKEDVKKKVKSENIPVTKILKLSKLKTDYRPFEAKRKLCDSYDMFFADRRVIQLLPRLIGKKFFATKKIPVAVDLKHKNWKEQMESACGSAMFFVRTGTCSVVKVGKLSMESEEIAENVVETLKGCVEVLPGKWKYVRSLHLKLSESLALPIYQSVPDLKLKIDGFESERSLVKVEKIADGGESGGEESVAAVKGKKKKGRIHEVRYMDSDVTEELGEDEIGGEEEITESAEKKNKKRKKDVSEVAETVKPVKKASKGKLKEKRGSPVKTASTTGKVKSDVLEVKQKSKDGLKAKKTKVAKDESGGELKPKKKKTVLRK